MIASLEGTVAATYTDHVVVVAGGIGYKVLMPPSSLSNLNIDDRVFLHTLLVVREDSLTLYGFLTLAERELFEKIITVSGIGPKLGLAILSTLGVEHLRNAVVSEKPDVLVRVPGIGRKTAQKIVFELKDKLSADLADIPAGTFTDVNADVLDTLVALGYSIVEAQAAIQALPPDAPEDVEERVRIALRYFV
ncbi:MAG: Holliday junction branch migration protein RuvA [Chloroflexota bacterium]|mgnify:CR=1 FL=1|nr:MAG: Holliday junction branch migration protein RuvA [Chloroflexota bacterium]